MNGNAKIESTMLGYEDNNILTCYLTLSQPGCGQGFGGWFLDGPYDRTLKIRLPSKTLGIWVAGILKAVGVSKWEDLKGKYVRVVGEERGLIKGIGHITEEKWFYPEGD